jgi:hypothetical protein
MPIHEVSVRGVLFKEAVSTTNLIFSNVLMVLTERPFNTGLGVPYGPLIFTSCRLRCTVEVYTLFCPVGKAFLSYGFSH